MPVLSNGAANGRSRRRTAALLTAMLLAACGGAPAPTSPVGLEARAAHCAAELDLHPERAPGCYHDAMLRLGRRAALVERLSVRRLAAPAEGRFAYDEAVARLATDRPGAAATLAACAEQADDPAWCLAGRGRLALAEGDATAALERFREAATARPDERHFAALEALALARLGDAAAARARVEPLVIGWPDDVTVQLARGAAALAAGAIGEARAATTEALALAPDGVAPHRLAASIEQALGDHERAIAALRRAVAADRGDAEAREALAAALVAHGRPATAVEHYSLLAESAPDAPRYAVALADALLATGAVDRARAWAEIARRIAPDDPAALLVAARAAIAAGDLPTAFELIERIDADPASAIEHRIALAEALADAGHPTRAESELAAAVVHHPRSAVAWRAYAEWFIERGQLDRSEGLLRQAILRLPEEAALHAALGDVFERQGNRGGARLALSVASRLEPDDPGHEDELARVEFLDGAPAAAVARWEALVDRHPEADRARRRLSAAYRALDEPQKAVSLLRTLVERYPADADLKGHLGETLLAAGNKQGAVSPLREALAGGADAARLRPLLATALADTGNPTDAGRLFAEALDADPGNRPLRLTYAAFREAAGDTLGAVELYQAQLARDPHDFETIAHLQRLVGPESLTALIEAAVQPYAPIAPELALLARRAPPPSGETRGAVLRDERRVVVDAQGVAEIHHRRAVLIQRPSGVESYRRVSLSFHADQPPTVVRARTLTPDGAIVPVAPSARTIDNPHAETPLYGDVRQLVLQFDALEPGAIIDYEVITRRPHPDLPGVWWDGYVLGNSDPTMQVAYTLELPADAPWVGHAPGLDPPREEVVDGTRRLRWTRHDLPPYRPDVTGPDAVIPAVHVSSFADWAAVDRWYHALFAPRSAAGPAVTRRARVITTGKRSRRDKIAAIYHHVEQTVRYVGVEFGIGAYQPRPPESTLAQGQGDCKDVTALMAAMLAEVGVEAWPALIRPRGHGPFEADQPSPGQFSHVVLYVPDPNGDLWLDATAGLSTLDAIAAPLRGRHALVVDGKGGRLIEVPTGEAPQHTLVEERTYELTPTGGGRLTVELELTGDLAGHARRALAPVDGPARYAILSAPGHLLGDGRIPDTVAVDGLDTPAAPMRLRADLTHDDLIALRLDGALVVPFELGVFTAGPLDALGGGDLGVPRIFERRIRLIPPAGYRFTWQPIAFHRSGPIEIHIDERRVDGEAQITARIRFASGALDATNRALLADTARAVQDELDLDLVMMPGADFDRVAFLEALIAERPGDPQLKVYLGQALLEQGRALDATAVLLDAQAQAPADRDTEALLALAQAQIGSFEQVEATLQAAAARPDAKPEPFLALAAIAAERGDHDAALALIAQGLARHPDENELHKARISILRRAGRPAEALSRARALADAHPDDAAAHALVGESASAAGEVAAAEAAWRKALALAPDDPTVLNNLAWLLRDRADQRAEALDLARRAVDGAPGVGAGWDTLAELHFRAGDLDAALRANARAIEVDPELRTLYETRRRKYELHRAR